MGNSVWTSFSVSKKEMGGGFLEVKLEQKAAEMVSPFGEGELH